VNFRTQGRDGLVAPSRSLPLHPGRHRPRPTGAKFEPHSQQALSWPDICHFLPPPITRSCIQKLPPTLPHHFPNSTLLSQHQQAITEISSNHITQSCHGARPAARSGARKNGRGQRISHMVAMRHLTCRRKSRQGQGSRKKI
jgi:hypothetical protein